MAKSEFKAFDQNIRTLLSVSRDEIKRREEEWKRNRPKGKRAKTSRASRAVSGKG